MKSPSTQVWLLCFLLFALQDFAAAFFIRAACDVSSASSVLVKAATGSAFCSSLLYPQGPPATTVTVFTTSTKPCKTVTSTETDTEIKTVTKTESTTLPTTKVKLYTSTVLIAGGTHLPVNKRQPETATGSTSTAATRTTTSTAVSSSSLLSAAAVTAAGQQQCNPTPSQLCNCPANTISAACSSLIPSPKKITSTETDTSTVKCPKTDVTVTVTSNSKIFTTYTMTIYPAPSLVLKNKTLTTTVPAACAATPYYGSGGTNFIILSYPYFPQTGVECCVLCYDAAFPNCVAVGWIEGSLSCELLLRDNSTTGISPSNQCPLGIENYDFGAPQADGNVYPGPCGY